ncbi:MarR family winged helix-turn-helix transcriptional regulator [Brevibacterium renqingii]|uniref:MarR family winged helix-turn-helix transcriptional regulator n=1 Tax=Brevibacterium renqingii TaxID=2776916 RepID=UPI001AE04861|nr:MarR family winged helix-turn-helix transcriptional regulator [Brevibacterium renqingii]
MSSDDDIRTIAEALTRLQWRRGPGGPRGFGPPRGFGQRSGSAEPNHGEFPFGGRHGPGGRDRQDHGPGRRDDVGFEWREKFKGHFGGRAQWQLLIALVQAGTALGVSAIGEAIGVDQPRASRLVAQGVELGLLRREADPEDARRTLIALTDKGRAIVNRFRGAQRDNVDEALSEFTADERAQLAALLTRLADAWPK